MCKSACCTVDTVCAGEEEGEEKKGRSLVYRKELLKAACLSSSFFPCLSFSDAESKNKRLNETEEGRRENKHALGVVGWIGGGYRMKKNSFTDGVTQ